MGTTARDAWKRVAFFYATTLLLMFAVLAFEARKPADSRFLLVTASMWGPAVAAWLTRRVSGGGVRDFGWQWGTGAFQWRAVGLVLAYSLPVYVVAWLTGLAGFPDHAALAAAARDLGMDSLPAGLQLPLVVLFALTAGFVGKAARALGEEIGWRGFLVPELAKVHGPVATGLISGLMWAAWHYPAILYTGYNAGTPPWYALACFTVMVTASGVMAAWLRLRSGSLWPAVVLHGAHNTLIQGVLTPLSVATVVSPYVLDEFGCGLALTSVLVALLVVRRQ